MTTNARELLLNASVLCHGKTSSSTWSSLCMAGGTPPGSRPTQDLHTIQEWDIRDEKWTCALVLDGHGQINRLAELALECVPAALKAALSDATDAIDNDVADALLRQTLVNFDTEIANNFLALGSSTTQKLPLEVLTARGGSTVVLALVDPRRNVHVASLGDCEAFLVQAQTPRYIDMGFHHRVSNEKEAARILSEHPNEPHCFHPRGDRLFTGLQLSRGLGDWHLKFENAVARRLLSDLPVNATTNLEYSLTPPYLSNVAEVAHARAEPGAVLIMSLDGLPGLYAWQSPPSYASLGDLCADAVTANLSDGGSPAHEILVRVWGNFPTNVITEPVHKVDDITVVVLKLS